ncbi:MAG: hypothetical protein ACHQ1H_07870 [Nitrososphaerales archaeon]
MSAIRTLLRACPNCGKRFEVRLVDKKLVKSESIQENVPINSDYFGSYNGSYLEVGETEPVVVDVEEFEYKYKCKHCGHEWTEEKDEEHEQKLE